MKTATGARSEATKTATGARSESIKTATGARGEATKRCEYSSFLGRSSLGSARRFAPLHCVYPCDSLRSSLYNRSNVI